MPKPRHALVAAFAAALTVAIALPSASAHDADIEHAQFLGTGNPLVPPTGLGEGFTRVGGDNGFTGGHVVVQGDRLYLGSYGRGLKMYDVSDPASPRRIGQYEPGGARADAPPDAAVFGGRHIAVLNGTRRTSTHGAVPGDARTDRTEFLDVTDPASPRVLWTFGPDQVDGESHNGDIVDKRRTYFPSGGVGAQGLRIYDLRPLLGRTPRAPQNLFRGDPAQLWETSPYRGDKPVGAPFTHTHDVSVYPDRKVGGLGRRDIALLAEGGNYLGAGNTGSVFVIDVTDPRSPVVLNRWLHETGPNHHPIRYHHEAQFLDGDPSVMLVTDEDMHNGCGTAGGVVAVRLSPNLRESQELSEWFIPAGTPAPVCSVHVFSSEGDTVFFGSYNAGLQAVDYSDPANPRRSGQFIAAGTTAWGAQVYRGHVYVGDMTRGLDVFRATGG
jgi:hypothetical protein